MARATWILVVSAAVAIALAVVGVGVARRDREVLVATFSEEHMSRVRFAAREISEELGDIWRDLEFADRLVETSGPLAERERELRAVLAVVRFYHRVVVYDEAGRRLLAVAPPAPLSPGPPGQFEGILDETARRAMVEDTPAVSTLLTGPESAWYRVFAAPRAEGGAVAILADICEPFERLQVLAPPGGARLVILGPDGGATPLTPAPLAAGQVGGLTALHAALRAGESGTFRLAPAEATALGLGASEAFAAFAAIPDRAGGAWTVAVLDRADTLRSRERALALQLAAAGAALAVCLSLASTYLVLAARRTLAVQERLRAAERVARERERASRILESLPVAVLALGTDAAITAANGAAREALGPGATGGPLESAFPRAAPGTVAALRAAVDAARETGTVRSVPGPPLALAGTDRVFSVHVVPLDGVADPSLLLVLVDVTEQRALTAELVRAEKLATVGVLAAGIAHEIGTPLAVVRGRAERIAAKLGEAHPRAPEATTIVGEIDRIARIIRELLDYSRPSVPGRAPVDAAEVAGAVAELLGMEASARQVALRLDLPEALPPVAADPDQLRQVLVNVVLNGLHACAPGGRVTVRAAPAADGTLAMEVEDDGAGIPAELRDRVFDPFFTTKRRGQGTGLGLSIAARLVRGHGGRIELDAAPGRGTCVKIAWPLADALEEVSHG